MRSGRSLGAGVLFYLVLGGATLAQQWTPELALDVKRVSDVRPSPDGTRVVFVVATAMMEGEQSAFVSQIHLTSANGGSGRQLTRGETSASHPRWSPDGETIAFLSAREAETPGVWLLPVGGGEAEPLTKEKGSVSGFAWSPDGARIAFQMRAAPSEEKEKARKEKRDARVVDEDFENTSIYVVAIDGDRVAKRLTPADFHAGGPFGAGGLSWSPDGRSIVFSHQPTPRVNDWPKADISIVDVSTGDVRALAATGAAETAPVHSPDGDWIAFTKSDMPPSWAFTRRVHLVPASGGTPEPLAESFDRQPILVGWTRDGSKVLISETQRTASRLSALPRDGSEPVDLSPPERMVGAPNLAREADRIGFVSESFDQPPEAFVSALAPFEAHRVSRVQDVGDVPTGTTEVVRWQSPDGTPVEGLLTYPVDYRAGSRVPLLVIVHGGPTGVFTRRFIGNRGAYPIAAFAARGYAVLRCNVRGSSGYGREFRYANYEDWGGGDYEDIMSGVDHVIELGVADPERLGVMGWSYGGFMTSWIVTQTRRFKAASVGAGVTNLMSFTGTADIPGFIPDYFGGEYWEVFDRWRAHSAMFHVGGVETPTLIQHGEEDRRVPVSQGYEFYNALKRQGVVTKMIVYPRQPHGIREPKLLLDAMQRNLDWFDRFLKQRASTTSNQ